MGAERKAHPCTRARSFRAPAEAPPPPSPRAHRNFKAPASPAGPRLHTVQLGAGCSMGARAHCAALCGKKGQEKAAGARACTQLTHGLSAPGQTANWAFCTAVTLWFTKHSPTSICRSRRSGVPSAIKPRARCAPAPHPGAPATAGTRAGTAAARLSADQHQPNINL